MWLSQHQTVFTELVQSTLVRLCTEHVPYEGYLELDGLLCISSDTSGARQIVVKIHKVIGSNNAQSENDRVTKCTPKTVPFVDHFNMPSNVTLQVVDVPPVNGINRAIATRNGNDILPAIDMTPSKEILVSKSNDGRMLAWKKQAPQILKLLTKSEMSPASRNQMPLPTDLSLSATNGVKTNTAPSAAKKELNEDKIEDLSLGTLHSGNRWRCKICHIHCMSFGELELHMRSEHVRFVCRLCLNSFTLSCNLRRHMKLHAGVRPHICSHCSATFSRSTDLKIHMKKHADMRSERGKNEASSPGLDSSSNSLRSTTPTGKASILHECEICNKGFAIASHLADHRLTHGFLAVKEENTVGADNAAELNTSIDGDGSVDREEANMDQFSSDTDVQTLDLRSTSTVVQSVPTSHENAMDFSVNLSVKIPTCVAELDSSSAMREFVPIFDLCDSSNNDQVESNVGLVNSSITSVPMNMTVVSKTIPSRSKRKGMPVKRIEVSSDENEDVSTDDSGAIVHETFSAGDDTPGQESTPSPRQTDVHSPAHCTPNEEEEPNGQPHGDVDSKVYNCQYTGGCNTTWYGFTAYERHYTTMHGGRYPCPVCPQSFTSRNNRRRHADGHAGSPGSSRHQCTACGKLFARADISKEHRLTHTRSYRLGACTKCGDTGGNKRSSLLLHLKRCLAYVDIDKDIDDTECTPVV